MSIGERIKSARIGAGLSQRDLGKEIGLSAMAISKYETGELVPKSGLLIRLSEALDVNVDYFFRTIAVTLSEPQYRCRKTLGKKEENQIHIRVQDWLERYLEIEMITGEEKPLDLPAKERCQIRSLDGIEDVARTVREDWNLGLDPIENVMDVLEQHGIKVGIIEATDKFDALTFYYDNKTPVIAVNGNMPGDRQRYSLAHELGHLLLQIEGDVDPEKAAHRFAGAFLVPKEMAIRELGESRRVLTWEEIYLLKHKYGMSMGAWIYRARDLGVIREAIANRYWVQYKKQGWHKEEPLKQVRPERPTHMELLVHRALGENRINQSRAQELMGGEQLAEVGG